MKNKAIGKRGGTADMIVKKQRTQMSMYKMIPHHGFIYTFLEGYGGSHGRVLPPKLATHVMLLLNIHYPKLTRATVDEALSLIFVVGFDLYHDALLEDSHGRSRSKIWDGKLEGYIVDNFWTKVLASVPWASQPLPECQVEPIGLDAFVPLVYQLLQARCVWHTTSSGVTPQATGKNWYLSSLTKEIDAFLAVAQEDTRKLLPATFRCHKNLLLDAGIACFEEAPDPSRLATAAAQQPEGLTTEQEEQVERLTIIMSYVTAKVLKEEAWAKDNQSRLSFEQLDGFEEWMRLDAITKAAISHHSAMKDIAIYNAVFEGGILDTDEFAQCRQEIEARVTAGQFADPELKGPMGGICTYQMMAGANGNVLEEPVDDYSDDDSEEEDGEDDGMEEDEDEDKAILNQLASVNLQALGFTGMDPDLAGAYYSAYRSHAESQSSEEEDEDDSIHESEYEADMEMDTAEMQAEDDAAVQPVTQGIEEMGMEDMDADP